jgi:hypothetical protein
MTSSQKGKNWTIPCVRSEIKKNKMAVINTLQLAARKNLIQMSSDVTNYNYNQGLKTAYGTWVAYPN